MRRVTDWSATERGHVIYESRLELARLLFADFDASVNRIVAQPFLLKAGLKAGVRQHVPDLRAGPGALAGRAWTWPAAAARMGRRERARKGAADGVT
jgi:hypothetical protein